MNHIKPAKIFFGIAVLLFVAKPFIGFSVFGRLNTLSTTNILVKSFTKRKLEYAENSNYNIYSVQKKLADPLPHFVLRFPFFLSILFSVIFATGTAITEHFLRRIRLHLSPQQRSYLLNRQLII
jgi:hypothetical protein